jgi:phage-related protein
MPLQLINAGTTFRIYAWGDAHHCETLTFLKKLEKSSNSDAIRLLNLLTRTAEHGPPANEHHARPLGDGIYEFKAPNTARLLWFYDADRIIVCTHGFSGKRGSGRTPRREINQAKEIRKEYLEEKSNARRKSTQDNE